MAKVFGSFSRLVSLLFRKDGQDITLRPNQSTTYMAARDVQLPPGDEAHVIVSASSVATLTNKTFDADGTGNSITNIENADIKAGAAIDAAKIHDGSVSNTEFGYLNGVTSAIQTQLNTNATAISDHLADPTDAHDASAISSIPSGNLAATDVQAALNELQTDVDTRATSAALTAHTGASSGVHGVTGAVVGTTDSQSLTNKTLDDTSNVLLKGGNTTGATLRVGTNDAQSVVVETNNADRITARVASSANADIKLHGTAGVELPVGTAAQRPSSPVAGTIRANSDSNEFEGYLNGAWQAVGGGLNEQPLKNYLKPYATAAVAPGTLSTVAAGGNIATTAGLFYADATSGSAALVQSSSAALRGSFNYLSALSGADTAGGRFFQFPAFALEAADLGKPISLSLDLTGLTAAGWDVVVARYDASGIFQGLIPVAGTASSSTPTPSAQLLTGTGQQRGFFVSTSDSGHLYALRFRRLSGSEQVRVDTLYVGPQVQLAGAPVTDPVSFALTGSWTTNATYTGKYRQVGNFMELQCRVDLAGAPNAATLTFNLPSGFSIDTTAKVGTNTTFSIMQNASGSSRGAGTAYSVIPKYNTVTSVSVTYQSATTGAESFVTATAPISWASGDYVEVNFTVPIVGWSSNVTMAERAVEEYASTSGTWDAASSTTIYGPAGGSIGGTLTAARTKTVTFQTPIQATDKITVEVSDDGVGFAPVNSAVLGSTPIISGVDSGGVEFSGAYWKKTGTTTIDVVFGRYANIANDDAPVANWPSGKFWRVRKVSGGAAVGYPVDARNVVGDTTGTAVPTGYIGEPVTTNLDVSVNLTGVSGATNTIMSETLPRGRWLVWGVVTFTRGATWTYATYPSLSASLSLSTTYDIAHSHQQPQILGAVNGQVLGQIGINPRVVVSDGTQVVYLLGAASYAGGSDTGVWEAGSGRTGLRRVRIA